MLALAITQTEFTVIALIGLILLIGIVKKNAIMMIDVALGAERDEGLPPEAAIRKASLLRLRPILMTTLAAALGALPMALVWRRNFGLSRDLLPSGAALSLGVLLAELHQHAGPVALAFAALPAMLIFEAQRRLYSASILRVEGRPSGLIAAKQAVNE